ncbi:MAG TPA: hypothetical protein VNI52_13080 [Sphingobacteriaceae bacterium]|nr:hypothetical protein [Sphingobacteriaceae bacterium]
MEFNITKIDKVLLIQTLYAHAESRGLGEAEYFVKDANGYMVSGLPVDECNMILAEAEHKGYSQRVIDYHNGKPIKLGFHFRRNGEIITSTSSYDKRNGKFRFLEALLNVFDLEEILIVKKNYDSIANLCINKNAPPRSEDLILKFMHMLKHTTSYKDNRGVYWKFNEGEVSYKPAFM